MDGLDLDGWMAGWMDLEWMDDLDGWIDLEWIDGWI